MSPPSVGVIGVGFGAKAHLPALARVGAGLAVVCAARLDRARDAAEPYGARATDDWREVVADASVDVVVVATPPFLHREIALAALAARKRVVCEKPLGLSYLEADELAAAAAEAGVPTLVDFEFRALPAFREVKRRLDAGEAGHVIHACVDWHVGSRLDPGPAPSWKDHADRGGGTLASLGSHVLDYVEWLLGPVGRVAGATASPQGGPADDAFAAVLELESGALVPVSVTAAAHGAPGHVVEIFGGQVALRLVNADPVDWVRGFRLEVVRSGAAPAEVPLRPPPMDEDGRIAAVASLLDGFLRDAPGLPSFADGARSQQLAAAVRESAATGQWMATPRYKPGMTRGETDA